VAELTIDELIEMAEQSKPANPEELGVDELISMAESSKPKPAPAPQPAPPPSILQRIGSALRSSGAGIPDPAEQATQMIRGGRNLLPTPGAKAAELAIQELKAGTFDKPKPTAPPKIQSDPWVPEDEQKNRKIVAEFYGENSFLVDPGSNPDVVGKTTEQVREAWENMNDPWYVFNKTQDPKSKEWARSAIYGEGWKSGHTFDPGLATRVVRPFVQGRLDNVTDIVNAARAIASGSSYPDPGTDLKVQIGEQVQPGETIPEKTADAVSGLAGFIFDVAAIKRLPGMKAMAPGIKKEMVAWELYNEAHGGPVGKGAAEALGFGALGKLPAKDIYEKAGKVFMESGYLGGTEWAATGDNEKATIMALVPLAMRALDYRAASREKTLKLIEENRATREAFERAELGADRMNQGERTAFIELLKIMDREVTVAEGFQQRLQDIVALRSKENTPAPKPILDRLTEALGRRPTRAEAREILVQEGIDLGPSANEFTGWMLRKWYGPSADTKAPQAPDVKPTAEFEGRKVDEPPVPTPEQQADIAAFETALKPEPKEGQPAAPQQVRGTTKEPANGMQRQEEGQGRQEEVAAAPRVNEAPAPGQPPAREPVTVTPEPIVGGIRNVDLDATLERIGLPKLDPVKRRTWEQAREINQRDDFNGDKAEDLARELQRRPRAVEDREVLAMGERIVELERDRNALREELFDWTSRGLEVPFEKIERMDQMAQRISDLAQGLQFGKSETARGLASAKAVFDPADLSLRDIVMDATIRKGSRLTPEESADLAKAHDLYRAEKTKADALERENAVLVAERDKAIADAVAKATAEKTAKAPTATKRQKILAERQDILKKLAAKGWQVNATLGVPDPESLALLGKLALNYIQEGAVTVAEVAARMRKHLPDITDQDVIRALAAKGPAAQSKARSEVQRRTREVKREARMLDEIDQLEKGVFEPPAKRVPPPDHIKALQKKLAELRKQVYKSGRDSAAMERAIAQINSLTDQLANGRRAAKAMKPREEVSAELQDARDKIADLKKQLAVKEELANLNNQLKTGEFVIKTPPEPKPMSEALERQLIKLRKARQDVKQAIDNMGKSRWTPRKVMGETINTIRTAMATGDISGLFRQNIVQTFAHPITVAKILPRVMKGTFSEEFANKLMIDLERSPYYLEMQRSKLAILDPEISHGPRSEMFEGEILKRLKGIGWVIKASARNMTLVGNMTRASLFEDFMRKNPNATAKEQAAYADFLNVSTGIGNLGRAASVADYLSLVFFAPKLAVSRFQTPYMVYKHWQLPRVRKQIARDLSGFVGTGVTVLALAKLYADATDRKDVKIGLDPRDSDFGKLRIGNTRIDIWGGFQQPARLVARIGLGAGTLSRVALTEEKVKDLMGDFQVDPIDLLGQFATYKLSPAITMMAEGWTMKSAVGEPRTPSETAVRSLIPMMLQDVWDAYHEEGAGAAIGSGAASFVGLGVGTYKDSASVTRAKITRLYKAGRRAEAIRLAREWNKANKQDIESITIKGKRISLFP
jgi:hypothetical protein